jgi:hypothetical protein
MQAAYEQQQQQAHFYQSNNSNEYIPNWAPTQIMASPTKDVPMEQFQWPSSKNFTATATAMAARQMRMRPSG